MHLTVHGLPAGQGSKNVSRSGHVYETSKHVQPWRAAVAAAAAEYMHGAPLISGPVQVEAVFCFPRPKSHYRTGKRSSELRPDHPVFHIGPPDADKLARAVGDALQGIVVRNDSQLQWTIRKVYDEPARVELHIREIT